MPASRPASCPGQSLHRRARAPEAPCSSTLAFRRPSSGRGLRECRCRSTGWITTRSSSTRATSTRPARSSSRPTTPSCSCTPATSTTSPTAASRATTRTPLSCSHSASSHFWPSVVEAPTREALEAAHCWEPDDRVPGRPAMTELRQRMRHQQAQWRESNGHPIGSSPIAPRTGQPSRPVGSRLPLDYARETGATFLTPAALATAQARTSLVERHQSFDHQRLWADLLSSPTLAFNLLGDVAADHGLADGALHAWWPDAPGSVCDVRFAHSPGRFDPAYLNSLRAFDAAFLLDLDGGTQGILTVDVEYHDRTKPETPKPDNLRRYLEVAQRSGVFETGATDVVKGRSDLAVMWLEHLLLLSMLQHHGGT